MGGERGFEKTQFIVAPSQMGYKSYTMQKEGGRVEDVGFDGAAGGGENRAREGDELCIDGKKSRPPNSSNPPAPKTHGAM